jgi:hypothetical protein
MVEFMKRASGKFLSSLKRIKRKSQRRRWRGTKKQIYEEDTQHGELEKYNRKGKHLGSVDPDSGEIIKDPVKGRQIDV